MEKNHLSFKQKHTFVCPCGDVWAGQRDTATCQHCGKRVNAQLPGQRGGNYNLYGLFCCNLCGSHFSLSGATEKQTGPLPTCVACDLGQGVLHIIAPRNMSRPWCEQSQSCKEKKQEELFARQIKRDKDAAAERYGNMTTEEMLVDLGERACQPFTMVLCRTGNLQYVAERLNCTVDEAAEEIKKAGGRVQQRKEAAQYEKEKNLLECSFCGIKKPKEQVFKTNCTYKGEEDHPALWCGKCRKKEKNFFKHQNEAWHPDNKTCYECGHIRYYGCRECKGLKHELSEFQDWDKSTWSKDVYRSHVKPSFMEDAAAAASSNPASLCGFCKKQADEEIILKKRCAKCKRPHLCCNNCIGTVSCL